MNLTKSILISTIAAVTFLTSCDFDSKLEMANQNAAKEKIKSDSLRKALDELYSLVTIGVEDSSMQKFCTIPDRVKKAWWEYQQTSYALAKEYEKVEALAAATKNTAILQAQAEQNTKHEQANKEYEEIQKFATVEFTKNDTAYKAFISNPENIERCYPYIGSDDSYWSLDVYFDFKSHNTNYKGIRKMSEGFKKMLSVCQQADSVRNEIKKSANQTFEAKKIAAENAYNEAITAPLKMRARKISDAYMLYLQKSN